MTRREAAVPHRPFFPKSVMAWRSFLLRPVQIAGECASASMRQRPVLWLAVVTCCLAVHPVLAAFRHLWFDELFTLYLSGLPHLREMFRALPGDGNPPLYYLVDRLCLHLFGSNDFVVRIPSLLAYTGAELAAYVYVARRCGTAAGLLSLTLLATCGMSYYSSEARPYAFLIGFAGLALVSWQAAAAAPGPRLIPLLGVTAGMAGAIGAHHYGFIHVGLPLLVGEGVRSFRRKRIDWPLLFAVACGLGAFAFTIPFAMATHRVLLGYTKASPIFFARPRLRGLVGNARMLSRTILALFVILQFLTWPAGNDPDARETAENYPSVPLHEIWAAIALTLLIPVMCTITWVTTGYYIDRYAITAALGASILMGMLLPLLARTPRRGLAAAALGVCLVAAGALVRDAVGVAHGRHHLKSYLSGPPDNPVLASAPGDEPIVVANAVSFLAEWRYNSPQTRERLRYLADLPFAVHQADFLPEVSLVVNRGSIPARIDDYSQFVATHPHFLLYVDGLPRLDWTMQRLQDAHWTLRVIHVDEDSALYFADAPGTGCACQ